MKTETIKVEVKEGVGKIVLNRPEVMNALDMPMREALGEALKALQDNPEVRVVVLTGAGNAFCAGGDVKTMTSEMDPEQSLSRLRKLHRIIHTLATMDKPVIAAVNGTAVGLGCSIALACDIIISSEKAKFGQVFSRVGLVPDGGGMYFLPRWVGVPKAKLMVFLGDIIDAQAAEKAGMVTKVVPHEDFEKEVNELSRRLAVGPSKSYALAKAVLSKSLETDLVSSLESEAYVQSICLQTDDFKEGVKAFLEKREPKFEGR